MPTVSVPTVSMPTGPQAGASELPATVESASTFIPTLADFEAWDPQAQRGYGCENLTKWMQDKGKPLIRDHGKTFWLSCRVAKSSRNLMSMRFKRIHEVYDEVKKVSATMSSCTGTRSEDQLMASYLEAAQHMDRTRAIKTPDMKLSRWYDAKVSAETTLSTSTMYSEQLLKAFTGKDAVWRQQASEQLQCLNNRKTRQAPKRWIQVPERLQQQAQCRAPAKQGL